MVQWVKVFVARPDDPSSIPRTGETQLSHLLLDLGTVAHGQALQGCVCIKYIKCRKQKKAFVSVGAHRHWLSPLPPVGVP